MANIEKGQHHSNKFFGQQSIHSIDQKLLPKSFNLYDIAELAKGEHLFHIANPTQELFKIFQTKIIAIHRFHGDINGKLICAIDPVQKYSSDLINEYHESLFAEATNVLIGHMLTNLNDKQRLTTELGHPIIISMKADKQNDFLRRNRYQTIVLGALDLVSVYKFNYSLTYQKETFVLDNYLFINEESAYDKVNV